MQALWQRPKTYFNSRIRFKIILPYALLILLLSIIGVYVAVNFVAESLQERFRGQLVEAGSVVADSFVRREQEHLTWINLIAYTEGIDAAILDKNRKKLESLVSPLVVTNKPDRVDLIDLEGRQLLEIHRPPDSTDVKDYTSSDGEDLSDWPIVQKVLSQVVDEKGDKFVTLGTIEDREMLITIGPIKQGDRIVGAIMVSSYVQDLLKLLAQYTFAEVTLYDLDGQVIKTTLGTGGNAAVEVLTLNKIETRTLLTVGAEQSLFRSLNFRGREYNLLFGVFRPRGEPLGFYSVALPRTYIESRESTLRDRMMLIFIVALPLVFAIGYFTANTITRRVQHLMENAMAVASGDFTRRTEIEADDEIGSLANSLDHMTESLARYTHALQKRIDELTALYEGSTAVTIRSGLNLELVLEAVTSSLKEVIRGTDEVIVYLLDESGQLLIPRASTANELTGLPSLAFEEKGTVQVMLAVAKPKAIQLADIGSHSLSGTFNREGTSLAMIAPLIAAQETVGMLIVIPDEAYPQTELMEEDNERLLGTMANQAAIAIKNAQLFEATQQAYEKVRKSDEQKTQFIYIAAHELRTPLGAMMGYASYAEKRVPDKLRKSMRFMVASTVRMRTMVDAMLTIQRLDAGTAFLRLANTNIQGVIDKVVSDFEAMAELEGHTLTVNLPEDLPIIQADAEKVELVLSNLISNAIKFTPEGGRIEVSAQNYHKGILVSVKDNGAGIAPEDQERIFERFMQLRANHIAGHGGFGLGLTIVKQLVELHEGQVWIESEPNKGSTFFFTLPQETPLGEASVHPKATNPSLKKRMEEFLLEIP